jgi:hypothetical protein
MPVSSLGPQLPQKVKFQASIGPNSNRNFRGKRMNGDPCLLYLRTSYPILKKTPLPLTDMRVSQGFREEKSAQTVGTGSDPSLMGRVSAGVLSVEKDLSSEQTLEWTDFVVRNVERQGDT